MDQETAIALIQHMNEAKFLFSGFATSLFMVATLATGIRWFTRIIMGVNMLFWAYTAISIKYPELIDAYVELWRFAAHGTG